MEYNKLISVTGLGGLYELVGTKADGAIVRSIEDKTTKFISSRVHQFSHLESIEVYTVNGNVNLVDLFEAMKNNSEELPDYKNAQAVKSYFEKVYPEMDFDRVYASDMKKMVRWFQIVQKNGIAFEKTDEQIAEQGDVTNVEEDKVLETEAEDKKAEKQKAPKTDNAKALEQVADKKSKEVKSTAVKTMEKKLPKGKKVPKANKEK